MKKTLKTLLFSFCICTASLIAQETPSTGLTDADVKAYIKNYTAIEKEFEELDYDFSEENIPALTLEKAYDTIDAILKKYGISGPKRYEKMLAIHQCFTVEYYDSELMNNPETAAMMQQMGIILQSPRG